MGKEGDTTHSEAWDLGSKLYSRRFELDVVCLILNV